MKYSLIFIIAASIVAFSCPRSIVAQPLADRQVLTLEGAKVLAEAAEAEARANNWEIVLAISDAGGHLLYLQRMDGVQLGSIEVALRKARTASIYRRPTKAFTDRLEGGLQSTLGIPDAIPLEGGLPIIVNDQVIGGVGVSGVRPEQDAQIAQAGISALLERIER